MSATWQCRWKSALNKTVVFAFNRILLADRTRYSMNDFTGNPSDGTPIVLWPNNKDEKDQWFLEQDSS